MTGAAISTSAARQRVMTGPGRRFANEVRRHRWLAVAVVLAAGAVGFVLLTGMRPEFDAWGFLVWGKQALHWHLDTNAAPSWKPLPFLFTFAYALAGGAQLWLWMFTAVAAGFAGAPLAARIAYRLTGSTPQRAYARWAAAIFAGVGVLGLFNYWHYILIANADPMEVTLSLAAVDSHLCGRRRLAWLFLVLASLGRPEAWVPAGLYAVWAWRAEPSMRPVLAGGVVAIPAMWFGIARLTSPSFTIASDVALNSTAGLSGNKLAGVIRHLRELYGLPMQLAALFSIAIAILRRDRAILLVSGAALLWVAVEVALAYHGWNAPSRYLFAPGAVFVVVAGVGVGRALAATPRSAIVRLALPVAVLAVVVALLPDARTQERLLHNKILAERPWRQQVDHLRTLIARQGGRRRIVACGQPVSYLGFQPILAWYLDENVADIGWDPPSFIKAGGPIVLYQLEGNEWSVRTIHIPRARLGACERLTASS